MTLANYYIGIEHNLQAEHCLQASHHVAKLFLHAGPAAGFDEDSLREVMAQIERRRAEAYLSVLNFCAETIVYREAGVQRGNSDKSSASERELVMDYSDMLPELSKPAIFMSKSYTDIEHCVSYNFAKSVFLAVNSCLGLALNYYVLDGFVSDHVDLCMLRASAFNRLSLLEGDDKRKQAMNLKRVQAIEPIIEAGGINEEAYSGLVKTVLHEVGSSYMDMHDLKSARIESKIKKDPSYCIKTVEAKKLNSFVFTSVKYFTHFIKLYFEKTKVRQE